MLINWQMAMSDLCLPLSLAGKLSMRLRTLKPNRLYTIKVVTDESGIVRAFGVESDVEFEGKIEALPLDTEEN